MIIKVTNQSNGQSLRFIGINEFMSFYGAKTQKEQEEIALSMGDYLLYKEGMSGFFSLPQNTGIFQQGIDQDGSDFETNNYSNRLLIWKFKQFHGAHSLMQSQVFYQNNKLLDIEITNNDVIFYAKGNLNGSIENGTVEIECPSPYNFFTTGNTIKETTRILVNPQGRALLPLKMPQIFFGGAELQGTVLINAAFPTYFKITMQGNFEDFRIDGRTDGSLLTYTGIVNNNVTIYTENSETFVDAIDKTEFVGGTYPELVSGVNEFFISFTNQYTDVVVTAEFSEVVPNVF